MSKSKIHWYKYAAPVNFYPLAGKMVPFFSGLTIVLFAVGLYMSFFVATPGHDPGVLADTNVRTIVERGLLWATRNASA